MYFYALLYLYYLHPGSIYKNLKHFDVIHVDEVTHKIVKRGNEDSTHPFNRIKEVNFNTLGRDFRLILTPKRGVLHSKFKAYSVDGDGKETSVHIDHNDFYHGRVFGESVSHVSLHIENGVMTGSIHLPEDVYHVEVLYKFVEISCNTFLTAIVASHFPPKQPYNGSISPI